MEKKDNLVSLNFTHEDFNKLDPLSPMVIMREAMHKLYPKVEAELERMIETGIVKDKEELFRDYVLVEWQEHENMTIKFCAQIVKRDKRGSIFIPGRPRSIDFLG